ncbi:MAG: glycerol-3-phosphate acyltransferase [Candidatus Coproplasma sp.]
MKEFDLAVGWYWLVLGVAVSYLMGCFHFAKLIVKLKHNDALKEGGNPGAMNISRKLGLKFGLLNFFCDALKGIIPVLVGYFVFKGYVFKGTQILVADFMKIAFGLSAVTGHVFSIFLKFKGGKGISTTIGFLWTSLVCENAWFALIGLGLFLMLFVYVYFTEWGGMASLIGVAGYSIWQVIIFILRYTAIDSLSNGFVIAILMMLLAVNIITWGAHHANLFRLMAGEEHHTSLKKMIKKKMKKKQGN